MVEPASWEAWDREWTQGQIDAIWDAARKRHDDPGYTEIARRTHALGSKRLLDLGCGGGTQSQYLRAERSGVDYVGVDISKKMLKAAKRLYRGARFQEADGADLPDADQSFDVVSLRHVLELHPLFKGERLLHTAARLARQAVLVGFYLEPHDGEPSVVEARDGVFYANTWSADWLIERMAGWGFPFVAVTHLAAQDFLYDFRRVAHG